MSGVGEQARLRWRCRRGMRELDLLLIAWLERRQPVAPEPLRHAFEALLALEDDRLWALLRGDAEAANDPQRRLCDEIRSLGLGRG